MEDRERVSFLAGKVDLRGYLYLPEGAEGRRVPCVVLYHGFSGTMDRLTLHAGRSAQEGLAASIFDYYRNFGESGGEPRQLVEIAGQQEDIRAAVAFVRSRPEIDPGRIALWGNSLGGGHVVAVAAGDPRIAAVVQHPYNKFPKRKDTPSTTRSMLKLSAATIWDATRRKLGLKPFYIPMVGGPGELAVATSENAKRLAEVLGGGDVNTLWRNETAPGALLEMAKFKPSEYAPKVQAPLRCPPLRMIARHASSWSRPSRTSRPAVGSRCFPVPISMRT